MQSHGFADSRILSVSVLEIEPVYSCSRSAINYIFVPISMDLISSFEKSCLPREINPLEWNLSLIFNP